MNTRWLPALLLFLLCTLPLCAEEPWALVKDAEGIQVYSRPVPGTPYKEFRGVGDVKAPIEVISRVFEDIPNFPRWFGFCLEARQLRHDTGDTWRVYIVIKTPGPVADRDVVADVVRERKPGRMTLALSAVKDDLLPNRGRYVRMTELTGSVVMTARGDGLTGIVYTMRPDPAGYIPSWISNIVQKDQPFLTIKGMREMVLKDAYAEPGGMARKK